MPPWAKPSCSPNWMPRIHTGKSTWTKKVRNSLFLTLHLAVFHPSGFHLEFIQLVKFAKKKTSEIVKGIEGALDSQDDIIIEEADTAEFTARTTKVLDRIRSTGLEVSKFKCKFEAKIATLLCHKIYSDGVEADPRNIRAISI